MEIKEFYAQSLNVNPPWEVKEVSIQGEEKVVEVRVESVAGHRWIHEKTGEEGTIHGWRERTWRHLDTCEFETRILARVPRIRWKSGEVQTAKVPWAEKSGRFTIAMESRIIEILQRCPAVTSAASLAGISRNQAQGVMQRAVERGLSRRKLEPLELVGLDEKAIRKRHRYATILTDLVTGNVVDICENRTIESTTELLQSLPKEITSSIQAVAMDMWPAYLSSVNSQLPEATVVIDRFHVQKYLNEGVDKVRRQEHRELTSQGDLSLKGMKFAFLKNHADLRVKCLREFRQLLNRELKTGTAWSLKEVFSNLWNYKSITWATRFFNNWIDTIQTSGLQPMIKAAATLKRHMSQILNYVIYPITNASSESSNSRIQNLRSAARGLPVFDTFRDRILFHLGGLSMNPSSN